MRDNMEPVDASKEIAEDHAPRKAKGVRGDGVEIESKKKQKKSSKGATSTAIQSRELVVSATLDEAYLPTHLSHSRQQSSFSPCNFGGPTTNPSLNNGMSEYRNTAYAGVLSQGSSNSYQYPGRNVANESEGTNMEGLQG
ncbi:uncharacterized protein LOC130136096 isoform X2 [Syzygium oleosum]|uniref:uncharacterized protein LOC130136096 isoform X2 n=1 Tax=Syzygium oleosum TaxID=219896 RepID=UPI0024BBC10C|nr:uncharacterized protein LOC130136096 isoform X2 [Syzygium oleosum]